MALAKERAAPESHMALLQAAASCSSFYGNVYGEASLDPSSTRFEFENYQKMVGNHEDEERSLESKTGVLKEFSVGHRLPPLSDPGITQYVINFKKGYENSGNVNYGSLLSFENGEPEPCPKMDQNDQEHSIWGDVEHGNYHYWNNHHLLHPSYGTDHSQLSDELSSLETTSHGDDGFGWLNSGGVAAATECFQDSRNSDQANSHKRPHMGNEVSASKKHCPGGASLKKPKSKSIPSKDPQSVAAKNRRERISERLKTLQELVPNGSKVDLVTMLEKAISYVKFLQLQVKVLATDEFWPAQGGKAPEVSQVKEALDAILSSYKDRNSSSSK